MLHAVLLLTLHLASLPAEDEPPRDSDPAVVLEGLGTTPSPFHWWLLSPGRVLDNVPTMMPLPSRDGDGVPPGR